MNDLKLAKENHQSMTSTEELTARAALTAWVGYANERFAADLEIDEEGMIEAAFEGGHYIWVQAPEAGQEFLATAFVAPLPEDPAHRYEVCRQLLKLNMFQVQVKGGALALDDSGGNICLCYLLHIDDFDAESLVGFLAFLCEVVPEIRAALGLPGDLLGAAAAPTDLRRPDALRV